jgi:hypothetical protein
VCAICCLIPAGIRQEMCKIYEKLIVIKIFKCLCYLSVYFLQELNRKEMCKIDEKLIVIKMFYCLYHLFVYFLQELDRRYAR